MDLGVVMIEADPKGKRVRGILQGKNLSRAPDQGIGSIGQDETRTKPQGIVED